MSDPVIKRVNYFDRQFLRAADFQQEQDYYVNRHRWHNQVFHTPGVIADASGGLGDSLRVTRSTDQPKTVLVSKGAALDSDGREIILSALSTSSDSFPSGSSESTLSICYDEKPSDPSTDPGVAGACTRWTEGTKLTWDSNGGVPLATVKRDADGTLLITDVRQPAGSKVGTSGMFPALSVQHIDVGDPSVFKDELDPIMHNHGELRMYDNPIWFRGIAKDTNGPDKNHGIMHVQDFGGVTGIDGPILFGCGGALGSNQNNTQSVALKWDRSQNVTVYGSLTVGPFSTGDKLMVTGDDCGLYFARRTLTSWPTTPAAGDRFAWYNGDGNARLWTDQMNLLTVETSGALTVTGDFCGLCFARRGKWLTGPLPANADPGDRFAWYNDDGNACLWTDQKGNLLTVGADGKVGIGTTTPGGRLQVVDAECSLRFAAEGGPAVLRVQNSAHASLSVLDLGNDTRNWQLRVDGGDGNKFKLYDATRVYTPVTVDTAGNVGIGTEGPGSRLVISDGTNGVSLHPGTASGIGFNRNVADGTIYNSGISAWQFTARDAHFALEGYNGAVTSWAVTKAGNVGIGTEDPKATLHITGTHGGPPTLLIEHCESPSPDVLNQIPDDSLVFTGLVIGADERPSLAFAWKPSGQGLRIFLVSGDFLRTGP